jgi:hypothetical protein
MATRPDVRVRSRLTGGSGGRSRLRARRRSLRMICATPARVSRSVPGSMCLRCNGCLDTSRPKSRWTPTRTCLTTIWTRFRPRCMPGIRRKMWAQGGLDGSQQTSESRLPAQSGLSISAGGGTRTPTLSRAPAPKAGVSANSTTPARPAIVPPLRPSGALSVPRTTLSHNAGKGGCDAVRERVRRRPTPHRRWPQ